MNAHDLTLNIAVNLGRLARWADEGKHRRIDQFLRDTESYIVLLEKTTQQKRFQQTFRRFRQAFTELKNNPNRDKSWAEDALTWANILTHRAKLA